jgi:hypothetical protein
MIVAHLLVGVGFTWIYLKGREAKPFLCRGSASGSRSRC